MHSTSKPQDTLIRPTLIERLNSLLPIPYFLSTLLIAALMGPLGYYIADILTYPDLSTTTTAFLAGSLHNYTISQRIGNIVVYPGLIFYCGFMLRYMRQRIIRIEQDLVQGSPDWENTIKKAFSGISRTLPALAFTLVFALLTLPFIILQLSSNQGISQLEFAISFPLFLFGAGSFIWMYVSSLYGLYKIGTQPVKLRSHTEDPLMGLGGLGKISLTLTIVFLIAVFLAVYEFTAYATAFPILLSVFFSGGLIAIGVAMFFLPLENIHRRMIKEREKLRNQNLAAILGILSNTHTEERSPALQDVRRMLVLEHEADQIKAIPSWPFDTASLRSLAAIVFAVVASTAAHLIIVFLKI